MYLQPPGERTPRGVSNLRDLHDFRLFRVFRERSILQGLVIRDCDQHTESQQDFSRGGAAAQHDQLICMEKMSRGERGDAEEDDETSLNLRVLRVSARSSRSLKPNTRLEQKQISRKVRKGENRTQMPGRKTHI